MTEEVPKPEVPEWWKSTLTAAWVDTRMESDRTIVAVSAAGVGLLVTLLTTVGVPSWWIILLYAVAFLAFISAMVLGIMIFRRNANHLEEAIVDPDKAHSSATRATLRGLDRAFWIAFGLGVAASIAIGTSSAVASLPAPDPGKAPSPVQQGDTVGRRDEGRRSTGAGDTTESDGTVQEELGRDHQLPTDSGVDS